MYAALGDMAARNNCGGCGSTRVEATKIHGLFWCRPCWLQVREADAWQEHYVALHPVICRESPGAAALAWLQHFHPAAK